MTFFDLEFAKDFKKHIDEKITLAVRTRCVGCLTLSPSVINHDYCLYRYIYDYKDIWDIVHTEFINEIGQLLEKKDKKDDCVEETWNINIEN